MADTAMTQDDLGKTLGALGPVKLTATEVLPDSGEVSGLFFEITPVGDDALALVIELWKLGADDVRRPMPVLSMTLQKRGDGRHYDARNVTVKGHDVATDQADLPALLTLAGALRRDAENDHVPDFAEVLNAPAVRLVA